MNKRERKNREIHDGEIGYIYRERNTIGGEKRLRRDII